MPTLRWVDTVASLQTLSGMAIGDVALLAGFYAACDGGGGELLFESTVPQQVQITNASNATSIVITTAVPHLLTWGQQVILGGVLGNTAANGISRILATTSTTFTINRDGTGSGVYVTGTGIVGDGATIPSNSATTGRWRRFF